MQQALAAAVDRGSTVSPQWLSLSLNGEFILTSAKVEMGQGVDTAWAMIVAEELAVPVENIQIVRAHADSVFRDSLLQRQATYGSTGISAFFATLTDAAIVMRTALIDAAAARWSIAAAECIVEDGAVRHTQSKRALSYRELAATLVTKVSQTAARASAKEKPRAEARLLGKPVLRIDSRAKVTGEAKFGIDETIPGMKTALLVFPPKIGGRVKSIDTSAINTKGFVSATPNSVGATVIADGFWPAKQAKSALKIEWYAPETLHPDSDALEARYRKRIEESGVEVRKVGAPPTADGLAATSADYFAPFLAHAPLEPLNCIAHYNDGVMQIWSGTQDQETAVEAVVSATKLPKEKIRIHSQLIGGGFGRRAAPDFIRAAAEIAMRVKHPVKLIYERAEDMQSLYYRPASLTRLSATTDRDGLIKHFAVKVVSPALTQHFGGSLNRTAAGGEFDFFAVQGLTTPIYAIPNRESRYVRDETGIPTWIWRGVGLSQNVFSLECFIDELANRAGIDPIAFRLANIPSNETPASNASRARTALMLARDR
jgi:isoquinoline 1-oxidoreductase subunit beta